MPSGTPNYLYPAYLPVPEFNNLNLSHSRKLPREQQDSNRVRKPPKLNPKQEISFTRSPSPSYAHLISFKDNSSCNDALISSAYDKDTTATYYDQCFQTISKIGEGSFGEVFKVRSKEDGLLYAVKKSKEFFRSSNYRQERFEEVRRYEQFSGHEHCVTLYKAWRQDDRLYMQMELCKGSLESYLAEEGRIPESMIWSILLDLLLALKCLHDRNLIHLDIKLENILIADDRTCKLADFGLVVDLESAKRNHPTEGDNRYVAPELMQGHFTKAADVFSLGISILELSCNLELPRNGPLWQELRSNVFPDEFMRELSIDLQQIIRKMMNAEPRKRPTVDQLLDGTKLIALQQNRKRWKYVKSFKNLLRRTRRFIWTKLCNLKNYTCSLFTPVIRGLQLSSTRTSSSTNHHNTSSTIDSNGSFVERAIENPEILDSPILSGAYEDSGPIINSTPLSSISRRYRGNHIAKLNNSRSNLLDSQTSTLICKKLFTKSDDSD